MDIEAVSIVILGVMACGFALLHVFYLIFVGVRPAHSHGSESPRQWLALHASFVSGLTAGLYVWLLGNGDPSARWLAYSLCSTVLVLSTYDKLVKHDPKHWTPYPAELYGALLATFVTVVSGYFLSAPMPLGTRTAGFVLASLPFIAIPVLLSCALKRRERSIYYNKLLPVVVAVGLVWFVYPVVYILSPEMTSIIGEYESRIIYVCADMITKVAYGLFITFIFEGERNAQKV